MKGGINATHFCSGYTGSCGRFTSDCTGDIVPGERCPCYHRKWPTPEQFKEEYGEEWKGSSYFLHEWIGSVKVGETEWVDYIDFSDFTKLNGPQVCACTPWGRPKPDWRPE